MMSHLLDALEKGEDIGHYGRLTFAMVAHHFLDKAELIKWPNPDDPDSCNVYRELDLPDEIFENIQDYREGKAS